MEMHDLSHIWPDWQIEGTPLGVGSFGSVYKAVRRDNMVESYAAVKIISIPRHPSEIDSLRAEGLDASRATTYLQGIVNDCVSEIQLMESLKGIQNIVSVEDYKVIRKTDQIGWDIYIRMELLTPLTTYITHHPMTEKDVVKLGCDMCTALEVCGKKGIIHRDIKPENIFVNEFGDFKLGDFGIAKKLEGQISNLSRKGTPNYMAPEVANSKEYDSRVDTYSLGIVLYRFMNKNRLPFLNTEEQLTNPLERENASTKRLRGEKLPPPSEASPKMADVVLKACAYNPNARFQDATQMKEALQGVLVGGPVKKTKKAWPIVVVLLTLLLLAGSAAGLYFTGLLEDLLPGLLPGGNTDVPETTASTQDTGPSPEELMQEQINAILAEVDGLVEAKDLEGAIARIQAAMTEYPDAQELKDKLAACETLQKEQLRDAVLADAKALADSKDYDSAIALLREAISQQGELPEFLAACETYEATRNTLLRSEALSEANRLAGAEEYLAAIQLINDTIKEAGSDKSLNDRLAELEINYVNQVIKKADDMLLVENFDGAESLINAAIKQFPNNETLHSELARVQSSRPLYLLDVVTPYKKSSHYSARNMFSMSGKNYLHGFTCMGFGEYNEGNQVFFNLEGKYSLISFTAGIVSDRNQTVTFLFHADGELVGKFTKRSGDQPSNHTINIVGCKQFVISVYDNTTTIDKSGTYGLADIMVKRNTSVPDSNGVTLGSNQVFLMDETIPYKTPANYDDSTTLSMGGLRYNHGFSCMGYGDYNKGNEIYFNLGGNYSKMTFTAGIVNDLGLDVTFRFYADNKEIYKFEMEESDLATTHTISVEGCKQLRISVSDKKSSADSSGVYGIGNIIMDKSESYNKDATTVKELGAGQQYLLKAVPPHSTPTRYDNSGTMVMGGLRYTNGYSCMGYGDYNKGNQTAFTLDGKYKTLSFTTGTILDRGHEVRFFVYADGKKVYEYVMKTADLPADHTVNVEGCKELVIAVYDRQKGADTSGTYGIANLIISQ